MKYMSDLQAALLGIGLMMVLVVYLFGWWKQRQYSRKFDTAFRRNHDDVLYQAKTTEAKQPVEIASEVNPEVWLDEVVTDIAIPVAVADEASEPVISEPCSLLNAQSDFIIELHLFKPGLATQLDDLWQRKFDFRKPLQVCGLISGARRWERVIAESSALYSQYRIALQLVDRTGVISLTKLGDFQDMLVMIAQRIGADMTVPDILSTHAAGQGLDALCAEVDQMVGINLLPPGQRLLNGAKIAEAAALQGMKLESDGAFHFTNVQLHSLVTLINKDNKPFLPHNLANFTTSGITLMLDVPRVEKPVVVFDQLVEIAQCLSDDLQVNLVDDQWVQMTDAGLVRIRTQIAQIEAKMLANGLVPGSSQARRLFS
jgi:hypothetical protein